jgi:hypothetical protein
MIKLTFELATGKDGGLTAGENGGDLNCESMAT